MSAKVERAIGVMREAFAEAEWDGDTSLRVQRGGQSVTVRILAGVDSGDEGIVKLELPLGEDMLPVHMRVVRSALADFIDDGLTPVPSGDPSFDARYAVKGRPAAMVESVLAALRAALSQDMQPPVELQVHFNEVSSLVSNEDLSVERLRYIVEAQAQLADALLATSRAQTASLTSDERAALELRMRGEVDGGSSSLLIAAVVGVLAVGGAIAAWALM